MYLVPSPVSLAIPGTHAVLLTDISKEENCLVGRTTVVGSVVIKNPTPSSTTEYFHYLSYFGFYSTDMGAEETSEQNAFALQFIPLKYRKQVKIEKIIEV